jgi:hypothetical protein
MIAWVSNKLNQEPIYNLSITNSPRSRFQSTELCLSYGILGREFGEPQIICELRFLWSA